MMEFKLLRYLQSKELGLPGEVADSRSGAGKMQDKSGLSCGPRKSIDPQKLRSCPQNTETNNMEFPMANI